MQSITPMAPAASIPVPDIDSEVPVVVVPVASVAPLDGSPDGERINVFAVAPQDGRSTIDGADHMRDRIFEKPLTYIAAAFSLGLVFGRFLR